MNNASRHEINTIIENLYDAQRKLVADDVKAAIGFLSIAKANLAKANATLVNSFNPEGTDGHIDVDENGYPIEKKNDCTRSDSETNESKRTTSELDDELEFLKNNLPGFDANELYLQFRKGLQYAVIYLANLADPDAANSADVSFDNCDVMKLTFRTDSDTIKAHSNLAKEHLSKLLTIAGFEFAEDPDFSIADGVLTAVFSFEKVKQNTNCYKVAPLVLLAHAFGII